MRISLKEELLLDKCRKDIEYLEGFCGKTLLDEFVFSIPVGKCVEFFGLLACKKFVDFFNKC